MYGYIYKVTNKINSKIYIGQKKSSTFLNEEYLGSGSLIRGAIIKYGKENFSCELLKECCSQFELDMYEEHFIKKYNSTSREIGYNTSLGGRMNDKISKIIFRKDPEAIELRELNRRENLKNKIKKKNKINKKPDIKEPEIEEQIEIHKDPYNIFVIHKGKIKKEVDKDKLEKYFLEGWEFGWPKDEE